MYVCLCRGVTDCDIQEAIDAGATTAEEVARSTGAGTGCGCCRGAVKAMVSAAAAPASEPCRRRRLEVLTPAA
jgi:bacterioferritin-associated ferredoxin